MNAVRVRLVRLAMAACAAALGVSALADGLPAPVTDADYRRPDPAAALVGRLLFFDRILSGNRNIACATCHVPALATTDHLSLGLGEGAAGLGPERSAGTGNPPPGRLARNTPALFNLGAREFTALFADGRVEADPVRPSGLRTPLDESLLSGFGSVLAAQAMFPILAPDEMAGQAGENDIADAVAHGRLSSPGGAFDLIAARVAAIPAYRTAFGRAFPEIAAGRPIRFADIARALAAFVETQWRTDRSPFDAYLRTGAPLPPDARAGLALFQGRAGCSGCHSGAFQTDQSYHAMGEPQIGPGKPLPGDTGARDPGRMRVTGRAEDAFAFRTPSLRNVAQTGPWGHAGAWRDLGAFLRHHAMPSRGLADYALSQAILPPLPGVLDDTILADTPRRAEIARAAASAPHVPLSEDDLRRLIAFLDTLTDPSALRGRLGAPDSVPSGLPVDAVGRRGGLEAEP